MNTLLKKSLAALLLVTLGGCSTMNTGVDDAHEHTLHFPKTLSAKKLQKLIIQTGQKEGWRMTEFKDDAVIAEKLDADNSQTVTVHFLDDMLYTQPYNADLQDALQDAIEELKE